VLQVEAEELAVVTALTGTDIDTDADTEKTQNTYIDKDTDTDTDATHTWRRWHDALQGETKELTIVTAQQLSHIGASFSCHTMYDVSSLYTYA